MAHSIVFACYSKACAPPPVGSGGSTPGTGVVKSALKALRNPDGGFTLGVPTMRPVGSGFAVALSGSDVLRAASDSFDAKGRPKASLVRMVVERIDAAMTGGVKLPKGTVPALGGWHNPEDGKLEINITAVFPANRRVAALSFARKNNQIAMANLDAISRGDWDNAFINTGGTGGDRQTD